MAGGPRSYDEFQAEDFAILAEIARADLAAFIVRNPHHLSLPERLLCIALCQGAALHHLDGKNGVKDFDVWMFFADQSGSPPYPPRRTGKAPFTGARFQDSTRRVDILGRTIALSPSGDPVAAVSEYLRGSRTATAGHLRQKAVVILDPPGRRGEILWPPASP